MFYDNLMWDQVDIVEFSFDPKTCIAEWLLRRTNSFYYTGTCSFKSLIHNDYYSNSIDLTEQTITINKNDNNWFKRIINTLNLSLIMGLIIKYETL